MFQPAYQYYVNLKNFNKISTELLTGYIELQLFVQIRIILIISLHFKFKLWSYDNNPVVMITVNLIHSCLQNLRAIIHFVYRYVTARTYKIFKTIKFIVVITINAGACYNFLRFMEKSEYDGEWIIKYTFCVE